MSTDLLSDLANRGTAMALDTDKMVAVKESGIGWMVFNNPERRNAVSHEMRSAILAILDEFQRDDAIRAVVMRGAGDKAFVSGSDISQFAKNRATPEQQAEYQKLGERIQQRYEELDKPLIAMIHGYCLGGGLGIALQADMRIAADTAQFGIPAARLGIAYNYPGVRRLVDQIGASRTKELLFTARRYSAAEALQMGLVNEIVPPGKLEDRVREIAGMIADNAPLSVRAAKLMTNEAMKEPAKRDLEFCKALVKECFASQDYTEGRTAFMEKRRPKFTGR